jgi:dipeptidyl aminopeptidase/acylaminoacyl peptidase
MTRRGPLVGAAVLIVGMAAFGLFRVTAGGTSPASALATPTASYRPSPSPSAAATPTVYPPDDLAIAAMRARTYPPSTLVPVRSDGDRGGFVSSVVSFQSDGLREYALMSIPDRPRPVRGWPVVIINHGYSDPATYLTDGSPYSQFVAAFAHAGYMVLKPDYRGHGQSQGVASGGHLSPVYAYDLLNLVSTLRADSRVDPTRIGLFGHSMGGDEVLRALVVSTDIKAAVFLAGVVGSMYDIFYNWPQPQNPPPAARPIPLQVGVENTVIAEHGTPATNAAFWNSASAINYVDSITAAVQINQDVGDTVVPKIFSDHLAAALRAAGKVFQYNTYPGDDHQFLRNRAAILAATVAFYSAHL